MLDAGHLKDQRAYLNPDGSPLGNHVLLLGFGKLNQDLARRLLARGCRVTAVCRSAKPKCALDVTLLLGDLTSSVFMVSLSRILRADPVSDCVIAVTPDGRSQDHYRKSYVAIARQLSELLADQTGRVVQVSSTGVYGQDSGEHLNELSPVAPTTPKSKILHLTEQLYQEQLADRLCVVRPSGIYSSNRSFMIQSALKTEKLEANQWGNRIHQADLVRVLEFALFGDHAHPVLIATDQLPSTKDQVVNWLRQHKGLPSAKVLKAPSSGKRLKSLFTPAELFEYPTYRRGYRF